MKDNLQLSDGTYLTSAKCDYLVCGYHSDAAGRDPFNTNGIGGPLQERLKAFFLDISADLDKKSPRAKESTAFTSLVFHGVIKGVVYDRTQKPPTPADTYAHNFSAKVDMEPVSVGTTPLDSVITFLQAHKKDTEFEKSLFDDTSTDDAFTLASQIADLSDLLYAAEADSYDSRIKARDLVDAHNFGRGSQGGFQWVYDKKKEQGQSPAVPSTVPDKSGMSELDYLARLNELQRRLDSATRALAVLQWSLFAQFFNYCSDPSNYQPAKRVSYRQQVTSIRNLAGPLQKLVNQDIPAAIKAILQPPSSKSPKVPARKVAADPFYIRSDPTLCIAGLNAGWPDDYLKNLKTRMSSELQNQGVDTGVSTAIKNLPVKSPKDLIGKLLSEAYTKDGTDEKALKSIGGKVWKGQPFCPIFVEWEAIYYNVDFDDYWDISLASSPSTNNHKQIRYINPGNLFEDPASKAILADTRVLSGRIPVLPQPSFSLTAVINQVISSTPGTQLPTSLQKYKDPVARQVFLDQVTSLKFIRYVTRSSKEFMAH